MLQYESRKFVIRIQYMSRGWFLLPALEGKIKPIYQKLQAAQLSNIVKLFWFESKGYKISARFQWVVDNIAPLKSIYDDLLWCIRQRHCLASQSFQVQNKLFTVIKKAGVKSEGKSTRWRRATPKNPECHVKWHT